VVLDTGAVTRGSGSKNEDKERNIRKWFVDQDLIDGVILLPENLFYNTTAAGVIVVLSKRKPAGRKNKIFLLNASRHFRKGKPKNYLPEEDIRSLTTTYLKGEPVDSELAVITKKQAEEADYNLSPSRWINQSEFNSETSLNDLIATAKDLSDKGRKVDEILFAMLSKIMEG
jgi:type I restriction enzyme M protein